MKHEGDSSLWKSLAVALGDGIAFGVGMKLAQSAPSARPQRIAPPESAAAPAPPPAESESLDLQTLSKILAKIDATLAGHMTKVEERLSGAEAFQAAQQAQHNARAQSALEEIHAALSGRIEAIESEGAALEERLRRSVETRAAQLAGETEARLHRDISEAGDRTAKLLVDTIEMRLLGRIAVLEAEVRSQAETIRSLRSSSDGSRRKIHDLLEGFGQACREAVDELERNDPSGPAAGGGSSTCVDTVEIQDEKPAEPAPPAADHRFDSLKIVNYQPRQEKRMVVPLVSSITAILLAVVALGSGALW